MISPVLPTYARADLAFERGQGAYLMTTDGRRILDFGAGIAVNALGHTHPHLVAALTEQAGKVWHTSNLYRVPGQERLAERLVAATFADTVFFTNSGAEANECAIKMARRYHFTNGAQERFRLITFEGAFHGRTLATIAAGGQAKHLEGFGPKVEGFDQVPFADLGAAEAAIRPETAGFLLEPIQGEGGVRAVPDGFMKALRALADRHGLLLLLDEVQTGMGRTGKLFAHEWSGVAPDIMSVAKGIGGGFPLGACLATERAAKGMKAGTHGTTYGGNPLAMAVGNAVLDVILSDGFLEHVRQVGGHLRQGLDGLVASNDDLLSEVRGEGLLLGLACKVPNTEFVSAMIAEGMIGPAAGDNVVRLLPPLIIGEAEIADALKRLERTCTAIRAKGRG